ncbi:MAG: hypothetical protein QHC81_03995 [Achromobacter sp.]|nr:hypothetical protein [Achromobacter sp.]
MNARDLLKFLMSRAGDNPNSLAAKAKVPQPTLYRFLSGTAKEPRLSTFEPVAKHYGIPVEAFFSEAVRNEVASKLSLRQGIEEAPEGTKAPPQQVHAWPFDTPYDAYLALNADKKHQLNDMVAAFIAGATPSRTTRPKKKKAA